MSKAEASVVCSRSMKEASVAIVECFCERGVDDEDRQEQRGQGQRVSGLARYCKDLSYYLFIF